MTPMHELLHRTHCDPGFGRGYFEIGNGDRMEKRTFRVAFNEGSQLPGNKFTFHVFDEDGIAPWVPMHRVQGVDKDGELIWKR